jgi:hypothetical protein
MFIEDQRSVSFYLRKPLGSNLFGLLLKSPGLEKGDVRAGRADIFAYDFLELSLHSILKLVLIEGVLNEKHCLN